MVGEKILDLTRFVSHIPTLKALEDSAIVILTHQSRPGKSDFTTLEPHAERLGDLLGRDVRYVDDIFGSRAIELIKRSGSGDVILLENIRFYSEETLNQPPEKHAETHLVRKLSRVADFYVNDAFSASHRPHASIIGFPPVLPSYIGLLMEKELSAISKIMEGDGNKLFILGGAKVDDSIKVMKNVLERKIADRVILTGLVANYCIMVKGQRLGRKNEKIVRDSAGEADQSAIKKLLKKYGDKISFPEDVAVLRDGERKEVPLGKLRDDDVIYDVGIESIAKFVEEIKSHDISVMNGPAGVFEDERFSLGTFELLRAMTKTRFSFIGGGHISTAARMAGVDGRIDHVSTGGGASILLLSGERLVGIETIRTYWNKKWKKRFSKLESRS